MTLTKELLRFCKTDQQKKYLKAVLDAGGSHKKAAEKLGVRRSTVSQALRRVKDHAERQGYSPAPEMTHECPETFMVDGVSTYFKDGEATGQWVKTKRNKQEQWEMIKDLFETYSRGIKPVKRIVAPKKTDDALLTFYPIADAHIGLAAMDVTENLTRKWNMETTPGVILDCFARLLEGSPDSEKCILAFLGDYMHWDSLYPVTPASGHILDADGFTNQMFGLAGDIMQTLIRLCLEKHKEVHLLITEGNHDQAFTAALRYTAKAIYSKNPRVDINDSETPYASYQHGKTMVCCHHGHLKKPQLLHQVMCTDFSQMWGKTTHRYGHVGHRHHTQTFETAGAIITQHPTLAPRDRYASRHGFSGLSYAKAVTYQKSGGELSQQIVYPYNG